MMSKTTRIGSEEQPLTMCLRDTTEEALPIVLVHTPKCAGKALRDALGRAYGESLCLHYSNPLKLGLSSRAMQRIRGEVVRQVELRQCSCVFGHFSLARYRNAIRAGDVQTGMFFREPLDLLVSYYFYHLGKRCQEARSLNEHAAGLLQLAKRPYMRNFYGRFLGGLDPTELDYVSLFEEFDNSLSLYEYLFGVHLAPTTVNVTPERPGNAHSYLVSAGIYRDVNELMVDNLKYYQKAQRHFACLCDQLCV